MLNKAVEWEIIEANPMKGIKFPREQARQRYLSLDDCERLVEACIAPHIKAIVTVALHTGMRLGEILNLKWPDLDFATGMLIIRDSKNGESRHVPMDSALTDSLASFPRMAGSDHVFPNARGGRLGWIQLGFRNARERAGLSDLHFHDLRHTFASQWMMHQRYAHLSPAYKQAMVRQIERIWEKPAPGASVDPRPGAARRSLRHTAVTRGV